MRKLVFFILVLPLMLAAQENDFQKAEALYKKEKFSLAEPLFKSYLEKNPKHSKTREYLGDISAYSKNWDEAIEYYEPLVEAYPDDANYHFKYGGSLGMKALEVNKLRALTYIDDIKEHFAKAAKLDPNHIEVRWALVEFYIQLPGIIGGSERKARLYANELLDISPVDGHLSLGYIAEYNDKPIEAEKHYKKAIAIGGSPHTYEKLTSLYENTNNPKKAIDNASKSLELHRRNRLNYQIGKIAAQYDISHEQGITCLKQYIKNHTVRDGVPKDWAYLRLAQIYELQGDKTSAMYYIKQALSDRPDFEEALQTKEEILNM